MSALFARTRRSKFMGILGHYWDTFLSTWNVLMHGNPANNLYGGIKIAACGELGVGVGEEERGSGEREVLEGFVGRIEGLVDVIVSKFGDAEAEDGDEANKKETRKAKPAAPWLGSGNEPAAEDGVIFLGTGALSRKSLRDVSHWVDDLYRWGPYAYGVVDNPSSNRRAKKSKRKYPGKKKSPSPDAKKDSPPETKKRELSSEAKIKSWQVYGLSLRDKYPQRQNSLQEDKMTVVDPTPIVEGQDAKDKLKAIRRRPSLEREPSSYTTTDTDSESIKGNKFVQYLKLGYGTHWSLGGNTTATRDATQAGIQEPEPSSSQGVAGGDSGKSDLAASPPDFLMFSKDDSTGQYLIGLLGDIEDEEEENADVNPESIMRYSVDRDGYNARLLLRTLTVELERDEDARVEADISIDLDNGIKQQSSSKHTGSEHTGTSNTSFESQDRNKTEKLWTVVYVNRPFVFVFLFELRTDALALTSLYRSLHYQIAPLIKPLLTSTTFRASKPDITPVDDSTTPIYDLVWDPKLLTVNSNIPNIPDPLQVQSLSVESVPWSRIEALNTHMQIINTYIATTTDRSEMERTCKTSRGWWVVWTRIADPEPSTPPLASAKPKVPGLIAEDGTNSESSLGPVTSTSRGTSTLYASMTLGPAHPFLEGVSNGYGPASKDKEIFLIRRASDNAAAKSTSRFASGSSAAGSEASWTAGPGKLAQGIGVDTKRYIEALLNLNR
jgi:hypothetical protein